jgi:hypothetical protein
MLTYISCTHLGLDFTTFNLELERRESRSHMAQSTETATMMVVVMAM